MKKLGLRLATALISFILGVSATSVWSGWQTAMWFWGSPQTLPYCEVARNGEQYHNQIIRVRATLILGLDSMYISEDCDTAEESMARVDMNGATIIDKSDELDRFLQTVGARSAHKKFNVIIEGRFNARFSMGRESKYHIAATNVELLAPENNYIPLFFDE